MSGDTGCPETSGGAHYFAYLDPEQEGRMCIDCGAPEDQAPYEAFRKRHLLGVPVGT